MIILLQNQNKNMKILLLGEYSNVYNSLATGLRLLGHEVLVVNDGDSWKHFDNDISLSRDKGRWRMMLKLLKLLPRLRGFDVVQLINPIFMPLKAERHFWIYKYLKKHNKKVVLGVMGDDYYYCHINHTLKPMRYSDYNIGAKEHTTDIAQWTYHDKVETKKKDLCRMIAADCDAIVAGAYEYWLPYTLTTDKDKKGRPLREKLHYIAFPICIPENKKETEPVTLPYKVFLGISHNRSEFKGTDIMLRVARQLEKEHPDRMRLDVVEGLPYDEYQKHIRNKDILLDQIYSYGPGMNALQSMAQGMIAVSGAEPEHYKLQGENDCQPIINVEPSYEDIYEKLKRLINLSPEEIEKIKKDSRKYVERNHDCLKVAKQYVEFYSSL